MLCVGGVLGVIDASSASGAAAPVGVQAYLTTPDQAHLLEAQSPIVLQTGSSAAGTVISIDPSQRFQTMEGFGASLTGSSAAVLGSLPPAQRTAVFTKLFDPAVGAGLSFLRQPMGASDFSIGTYSYDDMSPGTTDPRLVHFSIAPDTATIVPDLRQITAINPTLTIMATPWSPPAWMRSNDSMLGSGGSLLPKDYDAYATYFVKFIQAYAAAGISVSSVTVGNEPAFAPAKYPGMTMSAAAEVAFLPHLSAALRAASLTTKIVGFDHNWNLATYATTVLSNPAAFAALDGTAYHCYGGDSSAQSTVHEHFPSKNIYLTECSGGDWSSSFASNLDWDTSNLVIGAVRNWSKTVVTWNLALDQADGPTNGGCGNCRGVVTVNTATGAVTYNVEYDVLGEIAKIVRPGATRIASSSDPAGVESVAFQNPDGSYALVAHNTTSSPSPISVNAGSESFSVTLPAGAVESFLWSSTTPSVAAPTPAGSGRLDRTGWVATASSTPTDPDNAGQLPTNALDGSRNTRWSSGLAQSGRQWFQVDMGARHSFDQISLDAGSSIGDYPRQFAVYVSNDGTNWGVPVATGRSSTQMTTVVFAPHTAREIRIVSTGSTGNWWSIAELNIDR